MTPPQPLNGLLLIDKPAGMTSARAVDRVKRLLPRGTKVGHAGTLDPFATGLLVLMIGKATKLCESVMGQRKTYEGTIKFGATTETDDPESPEAPYLPTDAGNPARPTVPEAEAVQAALSRFVGTIQQRPPMYSALKVQGRRAADRVRAGQAIDLPPRPVVVYAIDLLEYQWPLARVRIDCGRGTYIRAIARDAGEALGVGGYLIQLRRTRIGGADVADACPLEGLTADRVAAAIRPPVQPQ